MHRFRRQSLPLGVAALALVAACVTVNIYFPAAKVEKTARQIVDEVYQEKEGKTPPPQSLLRQEWLRPGTWLAWLGPRPAYAEEATTVSNAAIRALKAKIIQRHEQLLPYYKQGQVGINKEGYLEVRDTAGLSLPQVASVRRLVEADNADRARLYQEVAKALDLQPQQVKQVQEIFAREWRDKAQSGWWIQTDAGQWKPK